MIGFLVAAVAGSWLFYRCKIPAGALIGAIVFGAAYQILIGNGVFPTFVKPVVQAIAGGFIGQRIGRRDVAELKGILGAGLLMFACMVVYTLLVGGLMAAVTTLDLATALASTMPAGLSDTAIISADLGADPALSTVMQMVRLLFSVIVLPQLAFRVCARREGAQEPTDPTLAPGYKPPEIRTPRNTAITVAEAVGAGIVGKLLGVPAGALIFAVFAVAGRNIRTGRAYLPKWLRLGAQCVSGMCVGVGISMQDVQNMRHLLLPIAITLVSLLVCNYVCAILIHKLCRLEFSTCLFGAIPAGVSDMALIATEMGGDAPKVAVLHLVRYVGILTVMPWIIKLLP